MPLCNLEDLCIIDPSSLGKSTNPDYQFDYISLSEVVTGRVLSEQVQNIRLADAPSRAKRKVSQGDILLSTVRPNLKGIVFLREPIADTVASTGFSVLRAKNGVCGEYIYHYLLSKFTDNQISKLVAGSNYPAINTSDVKKLKINTPSLEEQRKIAACLSTWDKAIDAHDRLIALKEQQKRGLMQECFSKNNNQTVKLNDVCTLKGGSGFPVIHQGKGTGVLPFIKVSDMNSKGNERLITRSNNWLDRADLLTVKPNVMPAKSTVFAKVGAALLLNRRRLLSFDTAIDNNMMAATPNENVEYGYLFYFMQTIDMGLLVQEGALPSVNQKQVGGIEFPLRPLEDQRKITAYLSTWDKSIDALTKKRDLLQHQKKGLMQKLLS